MLISTPNFNGSNRLALTPTMVRSAFLLWRSQLQREKQFAEIREFDRRKPAPELAAGASGNFSILNSDQAERDRGCRVANLYSAFPGQQDPALR